MCIYMCVRVFVAQASMCNSYIGKLRKKKEQERKLRNGSVARNHSALANCKGASSVTCALP